MLVLSDFVFFINFWVLLFFRGIYRVLLCRDPWKPFVSCHLYLKSRYIDLSQSELCCSRALSLLQLLSLPFTEFM